MPISQEIRVMPEIIGKFNGSGLTGELIGALLRGEADRDLVSDARRLLIEFDANEIVNIDGLENVPTETGGLMTFNHPNMDVLLPALLDLIVAVHDNGAHDVSILMGSEIPMLGKFNESHPLPGSISLLRKFHRLYSQNIISVPMSIDRKDYQDGRFLAVRRAVSDMKKGNIIVVSPEGHVELDNVISPEETFHSGTGSLSLMAAKILLPTLPVAIWQERNNKEINIRIGKAYFNRSKNENEAVYLVMEKISELMPEALRGPFRTR